MRFRGIALLLLGAVLLTASAPNVVAETQTTTFRDVLYSYTPYDTSYIESVLAWRRSSTDLDLYWYALDENDNEIALCSGFSVSSNFERCSFGAIGDITYYVLVSRYEGANTQGWLNVTDGASALTLSRTGGVVDGGGLRYLGEVDAQPATDPVAAAAREIRERIRTLKSAR